MAEIRQELLDELLAGYSSPEDLVGPEGLLRVLTRRLIETAAGVELTEHLGYERGDPAGRGSGNSRNGTTPKTLLSEFGEVAVDMPRDREGSFEPQIVPKGQTHWNGFDDKIVAMYAEGMSVESIRGHLEEMYSVSVSKDLISKVTDSVLEDVRAWQNRPLDDCYLVVWIDALVVKVRVDGVVRNRPAYLVLGLNTAGRKEALALVMGQGDESAKFWLKVMTDLRNRGLRQVCVVCCDGLTALPEAIEAVYADAWVQCCVVHLIRNSLAHVSYKDRKAVAKDLRPIYRAATEDEALEALMAFSDTWDGRYPMISELWRRHWERFIPFFAFPPDIRRIIYTTNSIEAVNRQLRKVIKTRGHFPTEDAALKLLWLGLIRAEKKWTYPIRDWARALHQFAIYFPNKFDISS
ncbi:MAG: IS256 family transposase [Acidimicrobiales bacterium]|nr:IS256 family transposase [Acidimicrobiales bacterium]